MLRLVLTRDQDESVRVVLKRDGNTWPHLASAADVAQRLADAARLMEACEAGTRPIFSQHALEFHGRTLAQTFLPPALHDENYPFAMPEGSLLMESSDPTLLNLPWELVPGPAGNLLAADARWMISRTTCASLSPHLGERCALPLRVLFTACAPIDHPRLDYEKEEEAMLGVAANLRGKVHLDIAEAGTFEELKELVTQYQPHVVHLSGHGALLNGIGHFAFEDERGKSDLRDAHDMAAQLFPGSGVRLVFVSGCQTAQAGAAGVCQRLTQDQHVPAVVGWGASIADAHATRFAEEFYKELAAGKSISAAVARARATLFEVCRLRHGGEEQLDLSFALPQLYRSSPIEELIDRSLPAQRPERPGVRYELLRDNIRGLREGFVGRRRVLQRTRPALRAGDCNVLLLTGIGGAGKSTLTTRLANRIEEDGWRIVALRANPDEATPFGLRILDELAVACQRLNRLSDERLLRDGERPIEQRLRLAVEVLNEARILLVLDNLESLLHAPPAAPDWKDPVLAAFFRELSASLTREGRAILTCRYLPVGWDSTQPNLLHEPLPDFTEADFFKYLNRHPKVQARMARGELSRELLAIFYKKFGATPRFVDQACAVLEEIDPGELEAKLDDLDDPDAKLSDDRLLELQQEYFRDLFLPELYDALSPEHRAALSRLAVTSIPLPLDGVASIAGLEEPQTKAAIAQWIQRALVQRFGEEDETPLYAVYPLQRSFLTASERLPQVEACTAHVAMAAFLKAAFEADRESELDLSYIDELLGCMYHAEAGGDTASHQWAGVCYAKALYHCAEFRSARDLMQSLLTSDRHPDVLKTLADVLLQLGDCKSARLYLGEALLQYKTAGNRLAEASTWHQLGSIDLQEGRYGNARGNFQKALDMKQAIGDRAGEASTWAQLGSIDMKEGKLGNARENAQKALDIFQAIGDPAGEASTWHQLGSIDLQEGEYGNARENIQKALDIRQAIGDRAGEAATRAQLGSIDFKEGKLANARENLQKALDILRAVGARDGEASTWHQLGSIDLEEGEYWNARENLQKALDIRQAIGDLAGEAATWAQLGSTDFKEGKLGNARENIQKALDIVQAIGDRAGEASTWHQLGSIDLVEGEYGNARKNFQRALDMKQAIGDRAGEAATLYQIGAFAWGHRITEKAFLLIAACYVMEDSMGDGGAAETLKNLSYMAQQMNLDQAAIDQRMNEAAEHYRRDRCASLVRDAFAAVEDGKS